LLAQEHKEIFVNVVGYDKNIKINDPTFSGFKSRYQEIDPISFISSLKSKYNDYGIAFIIFLVKTNETINSEDLIQQDVLASHISLKNPTPDMMEQGYSTRLALTDYYKEKDNEKYLKYKESAAVFKKLKENFNKEDVNKIIQIEK